MSIVVVSTAVMILYGEMMQSYRFLHRARARLDAQAIAFDAAWELYNADFTTLQNSYSQLCATEAESSFDTNGLIRSAVVAYGTYSDVFVEVWGLSGMAAGTNPLAAYSIRRYRGAR